MSVVSDGKHFDVPEGLIFSFPVTCKDGKWAYAEGLELDARSKEFFAKTIGRDGRGAVRRSGAGEREEDCLRVPGVAAVTCLLSSAC